MNIAILVCNKMTYECAAVGCFEAFNNKSKAFEIYKGKEVILKSLFHCNGCGKDLEKEMEYKIKQLKNLNVETIHMARCIEVECNRYDKIKNFFEEKGFKVVKGSH
ncbi:CGGC domain-containing protein [Hathewaya massiliensis]|uniref:CGGC domain-containing protein n=1 Tax=Hathewaya massiliensis TaxID=1964382 RepID=UPI0011592B08|nr:CGGC domain-containing protein [Hathewaya massiliensis]